VTSTAGTQLSFYRYDAFGNLALGTPASPFGYAGQYSGTSPNPGLDNMRARWYDPQTGGLTTRDPDFSATDQAYAYAGGDPVNSRDPSGACTLCDLWQAYEHVEIPGSGQVCIPGACLGGGAGVSLPSSSSEGFTCENFDGFDGAGASPETGFPPCAVRGWAPVSDALIGLLAQLSVQMMASWPYVEAALLIIGRADNFYHRSDQCAVLQSCLEKWFPTGVGGAGNDLTLLLESSADDSVVWLGETLAQNGIEGIGIADNID
jgi:RHS repeat-associated protein